MTSESQNPELDSALVQAAIDGDADSFTELCRRYYPAMVAIAHSVLGDRDLAEDAVQQAFAKAARRLPQLRKRNRFAGWLAVICRNAARDMARKRETLHTAGDVSIKAGQSQQDDPTDAVKEALSKLSAFLFYALLSFTPLEARLFLTGFIISCKVPPYVFPA